MKARRVLVGIAFIVALAALAGCGEEGLGKTFAGKLWSGWHSYNEDALTPILAPEVEVYYGGIPAFTGGLNVVDTAAEAVDYLFNGWNWNLLDEERFGITNSSFVEDTATITVSAFLTYKDDGTFTQHNVTVTVTKNTDDRWEISVLEID